MPEAQNSQLDNRGAFRYFRSTFWSAGQDSWTSPTGQNPDSFTLLQNIRPITKGTLETRWGNNKWTSVAVSGLNPARRLYHFSTLSGTRRVVGTVGLIASPLAVAWDESGVLKNSGIFIPTANKDHPRMAVSRGVAYFSDGFVSDWEKWDGSDTPGSATAWGIVAPSSASIPSVVGNGTVSAQNNGNPVQLTVTGIDLHT